MRDSNDATPIQWAADNGHLDQQIPPELLTEENLVHKDDDGDTSFHAAAVGGHLNQIPQQLLTKENLSMPNHAGATPLRLAAENGHLDQIPRQVLLDPDCQSLISKQK